MMTEAQPRTEHQSEDGDPPPVAQRIATAGALIDIDGVIRNGEEAIAGAPAVIAYLRAGGIPFVCISNNTSATTENLTAQLQEIGFDLLVEDVVTAGRLAALFIKENFPGARCQYLGEGMPFSARDGITLVEERGDVVITGGNGPSVTFGRTNKALRSLDAGAEFVAMHKSLRWMTGEGLALDAGGFVSALERASGATATVIGKPEPAAFEYALATKGMAARGTLMIGDDIDNDVLAAQELGMRGVLVLTGKTRSEALLAAQGVPDHVIPSIAELPRLLERLGGPGEMTTFSAEAG